MFAVVPEVVIVSVPLRLLPASTKLDVVVPDMKAMSRKSRASGSPKPATSPPKCTESSSCSVPPALSANVTAALPVEPPLAISSVPPLIVAPLATPPEAT